MTLPFPLSRSVNDILREYPGAVTLLSARGIDSCCRGNDSLADAAAGLGLDATALASEIASLVGVAVDSSTSRGCGCASHKR
jgi:iron-sulfur cluster repair protein YtfE (RIC family)